MLKLKWDNFKNTMDYFVQDVLFASSIAQASHIEAKHLFVISSSLQHKVECKKGGG